MVDNIDYDVFYMVMGDPMNPETSTMYVRNEANGFWNLGVPCVTDTMTFRNMVAMYPATVGATWTKGWFFCVMGSIMGTGPGISECIRVDTLYTTPAGTFECYHFHEVYNTPYGSVEYDLFMAPNIGIVGLEAQSSMVTSKKVLSSRSLK